MARTPDESRQSERLRELAATDPRMTWLKRETRYLSSSRRYYDGDGDDDVSVNNRSQGPNGPKDHQGSKFLILRVSIFFIFSTTLPIPKHTTGLRKKPRRDNPSVSGILEPACFSLASAARERYERGQRISNAHESRAVFCPEKRRHGTTPSAECPSCGHELSSCTSTPKLSKTPNTANTPNIRSIKGTTSSRSELRSAHPTHRIGLKPPAGRQGLFCDSSESSRKVVYGPTATSFEDPSVEREHAGYDYTSQSALRGFEVISE